MYQGYRVNVKVTDAKRVSVCPVSVLSALQVKGNLACYCIASLYNVVNTVKHQPISRH